MTAQPFDPQVAQGLKQAIAELSGLASPCEKSFLATGDRLGQSVAIMNGLKDVLETLVQRLTGDEMAGARDSLGRSVRQVVDLVANKGSNQSVLAKVGQLVDQAVTRLMAIRRVIGEIQALSINAKIQAARIEQAGIDFSVFTKEISRLGSLAEESLDKSLKSLNDLAQMIDQADHSLGSFETSRTVDLPQVQARLEQGLATLWERDRQSARTLDSIKDRSRDMAGRIAAVISALQINDITAQRIAHVAEALNVLLDLAEGRKKLDGADGILDRRFKIAAAACRLQALQLSRAKADFEKEVGRVKGQLVKLAGTVDGIIAEVSTVISGGSERQNGSFIALVGADCDRALGLLADFRKADSETQSTFLKVSEGLESLARDIEEINSIETDMRIMGLNATLKCGRLGNDGRTLSVIAQELRAYSRRTGEEAHAAAHLLTEASAAGGRLVDEKASEVAQMLDTVDSVMRGALATLTEIGGQIEDTIARARIDAGSVGQSLIEIEQGFTIEAVLSESLGRVEASLAALSAGLSPDDGEDVSDLKAEVTALLNQNYTMESERLVHALFDEGGDQSALPDGATEDVEEFFL